jgi:hypothetical protein
MAMAATQDSTFDWRELGAQVNAVAEPQAEAQCRYETTASMTNFRGGILMDIATRNNLYNLCMQAKGY